MGFLLLLSRVRILNGPTKRPDATKRNGCSGGSLKVSGAQATAPSGSFLVYDSAFGPKIQYWTMAAKIQYWTMMARFAVEGMDALCCRLAKAHL